MLSMAFSSVSVFKPLNTLHFSTFCTLKVFFYKIKYTPGHLFFLLFKIRLNEVKLTMVFIVLLLESISCLYHLSNTPKNHFAHSRKHEIVIQFPIIGFFLIIKLMGSKLHELRKPLFLKCVTSFPRGAI